MPRKPNLSDLTVPKTADSATIGQQHEQPDSQTARVQFPYGVPPGAFFKLKAFHITYQADQQLAMLKIQTGKTQKKLMADALNLLFEYHGVKPVQ